MVFFKSIDKYRYRKKEKNKNKFEIDEIYETGFLPLSLPLKLNVYFDFEFTLSVCVGQEYVLAVQLSH